MFCSTIHDYFSSFGKVAKNKSVYPPGATLQLRRYPSGHCAIWVPIDSVWIKNASCLEDIDIEIAAADGFFYVLFSGY